MGQRIFFVDGDVSSADAVSHSNVVAILERSVCRRPVSGARPSIFVPALDYLQQKLYLGPTFHCCLGGFKYEIITAPSNSRCGVLATDRDQGFAPSSAKPTRSIHRRQPEARRFRRLH